MQNWEPYPNTYTNPQGIERIEGKKELKPTDVVQSRGKFLERFDWTDTLITNFEKQAVQNILVEYHDVFARHRLDIGMNTEFTVKLTPKNNKAVYN